MLRFGAQHGYVVTKGGRRRLLNGWSSRRNRLTPEAERQAVNTVVQGSAADIMRVALPLMADHGLLCQVHDEVVLETDDPEAAVAAVQAAFAHARDALGLPEWVVRTDPKVVFRWSDAK